MGQCGSTPTPVGDMQKSVIQLLYRKAEVNKSGSVEKMMADDLNTMFDYTNPSSALFETPEFDSVYMISIEGNNSRTPELDTTLLWCQFFRSLQFSNTVILQIIGTMWDRQGTFEWMLFLIEQRMTTWPSSHQQRKQQALQR